MGIRAKLKPEKILNNDFDLLIPGVPPLVVLGVTGLEDELDTAEMPDRTKVSGGRRKPFEIEVKLAEHHVEEMLAMNTWYTQSEVRLPGYKRVGTLIKTSESGFLSAKYTLLGIFPTKRSDSDLDFNSEGELSEITWTISVDSRISIPLSANPPPGPPAP